MIFIPKRYLPTNLTPKDTIKQRRNILKSRKLYKKGIYYQRPKVNSFQSKPSGHIFNAEKKYGVSHIIPNNQLANRTRCSRKALEKIVSKGRGAFFSNGSRPNQTAESWGRARLASVITGGPASTIDYGILYNGCSKDSPALKMATKTCKKMGRCQKYTRKN